MPEIYDKSAFTKTCAIGRKTGRSKPDTGSECTADTRYTFCLDKILFPVFCGKTASELRIVDYEKRDDLRQLIFDVFEEVAGIIIVMAVSDRL